MKGKRLPVLSYPENVVLLEDSEQDPETFFRRLLSPYISVDSFPYFYLHHGVTNWIDTLDHAFLEADVEDYSYFRLFPFSKKSDLKLVVPSKTKTLEESVLDTKGSLYLDMSYFFTDTTNMANKNLDTRNVVSMCFGVSKGNCLSRARLAWEVTKIPNTKKEVLQKQYNYDIPFSTKKVISHLSKEETPFETCFKYDARFRHAYSEEGLEGQPSNLVFKKDRVFYPWYKAKELECLLLPT